MITALYQFDQLLPVGYNFKLKTTVIKCFSDHFYFYLLHISHLFFIFAITSIYLVLK